MSGLLDGSAFLPGDPRPKILDWLRDAADLTVEKLVEIVVKRVRATVERTPALREPLDLLMHEIYADATPT